MAQVSSSNFARAITGGEVVWDKPSMWADWARDGYGEAGSIDDLSNRIGRPVQIDHYLDDGYPDKVTYVSGVSAPTLAVNLVYGGSGQNLDKASQFFSPFRTDSPMYGYARDVAPVKLDAGLVTDSGVERIRLFTGQMLSTPISDQAAALQAVSAARLKMAKAILPPINIRRFLISETDYGLTQTWPVTWAMQKCGVYPSPPPVSGGRYWAPFHGGSYPYLPETNEDFRAGFGIFVGLPGNTRPAFRTTAGPFVGALNASIGASGTNWYIGAISRNEDLAPGLDFFSQAGKRGRVQFYVRGDVGNVNTVPGGSGQFNYFVPVVPVMVGTHIYNTLSVSAPFISCGIRASDRFPFITLYDGVRRFTTTAAGALPADGAWHRFGAAWDIDASTTWVYYDGVLSTTNHSPGMTGSLLPATNRDGAFSISSGNPPSHYHDEADFNISFEALLPAAEYQFSSGPAASPTNVPAWQDTGWTQNATVYPSPVTMEVLAEPAPREAWEFVASLAQSELASFRADENDNLLYLPLPWWSLAAQQVVQQGLLRTRHVSRAQLDYDPSKIRNSITLQYAATTADALDSTVFTYTAGAIPVPPGTTQIYVPHEQLIARTPLGPMRVLSAAEIDGTDPYPTDHYGFPVYTYICFNTSANGSGTYADHGTTPDFYGSTLTAEVTAFTAAATLITVTNNTGSTYYIVNDSNGNGGTAFGYIGLGNTPIRQDTSANVYLADSASITARGERNLSIGLNNLQSATAAAQIAAALLSDLATPIPILTNLELFGDPRRQPGDLVSYSDAENTGVGGLWRYRSVKHKIDGAQYTQTVEMRRARTVAVWDTSLWGGDVMWGE